MQTPEGMRAVQARGADQTEVRARSTAPHRGPGGRPPDGPRDAELYDALILSPGAEPIRPPIPGLGDPQSSPCAAWPTWTASSRPWTTRRRPALVIGGGYIGLEMAEALRQRAWRSRWWNLRHRPGRLDPEMATPIHLALRASGVDLFLDDSAASFTERDGKVLTTLTSGRQIACDFVVLGAGVRPETGLARQAGLKIGQRGGIVVDEHLRTSDPDIFAVGDAVEVKDFVTGRPALIPLGGPANREGRIAADNCFGRNAIYKGTQGTAVGKVFDLAVACTGASEKVLKRAEMKYEKVYVHPISHAGYYPGAMPMTIKLLFAPDTGRILGAQIVGGDGVDKRIDVLATALRAGLTVYDLEELELAYAPQYGSAKDPVNFAGFAAANVLRGDVALAQADSLSPDSAEGPLILDVRTPAEREAGCIPNSRLIPVDELRNRLNELPKDREILAYCAVGLRGYLASRILTQHGFKARNIAGGYKTYCQYHPKEAPVNTAPKPISGPASAPKSGAADAGRKEITLDCCGLQCPGPIVQVKKKMDEAPAGTRLHVCATDIGFAADIAAWCHRTGNKLVEVNKEGRHIVAVIEKSEASAAPDKQPVAHTEQSNKKTIIVFSSDLDR